MKNRHLASLRQHSSALALGLLLPLVVALAGCASGQKLESGGTKLPTVESRTPVANPAEGNAALASGATAGPRTGNVDPGAGSASTSVVSPTAAALEAGPSKRVLYFDFDSFVIKDEFRTMLEAHARALSVQSDRRLVVEGHTDERGGREYNLALGQKRAQAVLRALTVLGVPEAQMEAVSFGQERPAAQGSGEAAWALNRRAELKDR